VEQRLRTKTGEWRWVLSRGRCVTRDDDGQPLRVAGTYLDITERKRLEDELRARSVRDGLTGLSNRRAYDERLDQEWRRAARAARPLSLIMCDVDRFKPFNDRYGHLAGDECLKRLAAVILRTFQRATDFPARWGGEEFAVVLAETDHEAALQAAERLRRAVQRESIPRDDLPTGVVTVSVGVATARPEPETGPDPVETAADEALYEAKHAGRNRVAAKRAEPG